jgi:hypothetical protein
MRILSIIGGSVLILLGIAKGAGLFRALVVGSTGPGQFVVKQLVYAVALVMAGAAMLLTGRGSRERPDAVEGTS